MPDCVTSDLTDPNNCSNKCYMNLTRYIHERTTVTAFALKIRKSRAQVHRYMRGENLTKSVIEEICRATDGVVTPASFFDDAAELEAAE